MKSIDDVNDSWNGNGIYDDDINDKNYQKIYTCHVWSKVEKFYGIQIENF